MLGSSVCKARGLPLTVSLMVVVVISDFEYGRYWVALAPGGPPCLIDADAHRLMISWLARDLHQRCLHIAVRNLGASFPPVYPEWNVVPCRVRHGQIRLQTANTWQRRQSR